MIKLGDQISKLRNIKRISQSDLAEHLKVTRQAVSNWERNKTYPDIEVIKKISEYFDVTLDNLLLGIEESKNTKKLNMILLFNLLLLICHIVCAILEIISFIALFVVPILVVFIAIIIHYVFKNSLKTGDFSIIAGYDKHKDDDVKVRRQLENIELLILIISLLCNLLFFTTYVVRNALVMPITLIILALFIIGFVISIFTIQIKEKTR